MEQEIIMPKPKVLIATGLGLNSQEELGKRFSDVGADVDFKHLKEILENPDILDIYHGLGLPGGFSGGDHLGAGQFVANMIRQSKKGMSKLEEKINDETFPVIAVCNFVQALSRIELFPIPIGTVQNDVGKHMTQYWDIGINEESESIWTKELKKTNEPIFAPISHGEGRFYLGEKGLQKAHDMKMIAMRYVKGQIQEYFKYVRGDIYNPNGSDNDIAGFAWKNNLALFPHFERLHKNVQRPDREDARNRGLDLLAPYEPTMLLFKGAVDYMKTQIQR